ncbi:Ser/Thr protein kinase RdoA (MazF antagonist) [Luteibacter sp. Sphag1AF]|uniref:phosphotransferase n=1 Tax=Luteibacter sp. Sphag1AF TaxID=2587031 RepID=UPI0016116746|nr:phosphotransferase [Luteibacter sp. Sphag1AF]MBB3228056.1 Ser/Thr protein kinase RdoA (MazF antagonist) [Luteibacter sp. Sphag1AF]
MSDTPHRIHGLAGNEVAPDWAPITSREVNAVLAHYPDAGTFRSIDWHSPRPLSAACLVQTTGGSFFLKRHHESVRPGTTLEDEHRFMHTLREHGVPVPRVLSNSDNASATWIGDWVYELHERASGVDLYRDAFSWQPLDNAAHARTAGTMLASLHDASEAHTAAQRNTHILVARIELIASVDPVATLRRQLPERPALATYMHDTDKANAWHAALAPWHAAVQPHLAQQPPLWTHGDWHVSNLCWSDAGENASITSVLDFGLAARTFALFDLATAIERNAIAWLDLDGARPARADIALALIQGYHQRRPLSSCDLDVLAALLPIVHVDFALSEVEYYQGITQSRADADVAWHTFLLGHMAWFKTTDGVILLDAIRNAHGRFVLQ